MHVQNKKKQCNNICKLKTMWVNCTFLISYHVHWISMVSTESVGIPMECMETMEMSLNEFKQFTQLIQTHLNWEQVGQGPFFCYPSSQNGVNSRASCGRLLRPDKRWGSGTKVKIKSPTKNASPGLSQPSPPTRGEKGVPSRWNLRSETKGG